MGNFVDGDTIKIFVGNSVKLEFEQVKKVVKINKLSLRIPKHREETILNKIKGELNRFTFFNFDILRCFLFIEF